MYWVKNKPAITILDILLQPPERPSKLACKSPAGHFQFASLSRSLDLQHSLLSFKVGQKKHKWK